MRLIVFLFAAALAAAALIAPATPSSPSYTNSWSSVRGVNYVPSYSSNPIETWMDYDEATIERELGYAHALGLNAIRVFLHMFPWAADRQAFLSKVEHLVAASSKRGLQPLLVLLDDDFYDVANVTTVAEMAAFVSEPANYRGGVRWMANPGMLVLGAGAPGNWPLVHEYLADVVGAHAGDRRLLGWDVMNEPSRHAGWAGGLTRFVAAAVNATVKLAGGVPATVDQYAGVPANLASDLETALSYHSYWHYGKWQDCAGSVGDVQSFQEANGAAYLKAAAALDKPVLVSEFGQSDCYCPAATGFQAAGVGWIAWELITSHDQFGDFQGLVHANGTNRSQAEAACLARLAL
eukprot:g3672.t1